MIQSEITPQTDAVAEKPLVKELDTRVVVASDFLRIIDQAVGETKIDDVTGKISYAAQTRPITNSSLTWFVEQHSKIVQEYSTRHDEIIKELKIKPGVLDVQLIGGAIVVTFDSSKQTIDLALGDEQFKGDVDADRGSYKNANDRFLGAVFIDINQTKRSDNVSAMTTAQHELHHHNLAMVDYLLSQDPKVNMASAVRKIGNSALFGKGVKPPATQGFIARDTLRKDGDQYSALLGREYSDIDQENVEDQLRYLDELHSSFLQKKAEWFSTKQDVYSTRKRGKHWEVVGANPEDQAAAKELLGYLQAIYIMDTVIQSIKKQVEGNPSQIPDYIKEMISSWPDVFGKIGGIIGASRTVQQARRLVATEWTAYKKKNQLFLDKNKETLDKLVGSWEKIDIQAENMRNALLS